MHERDRQTDGRTPGHSKDRAYAYRRAVKSYNAKRNAKSGLLTSIRLWPSISKCNGIVTEESDLHLRHVALSSIRNPLLQRLVWVAVHTPVATVRRYLRQQPCLSTVRSTQAACQVEAIIGFLRPTSAKEFMFLLLLVCLYNWRSFQPICLTNKRTLDFTADPRSRSGARYLKNYHCKIVAICGGLRSASAS